MEYLTIKDITVPSEIFVTKSNYANSRIVNHHLCLEVSYDGTFGLNVFRIIMDNGEKVRIKRFFYSKNIVSLNYIPMSLDKYLKMKAFI